MKLHTERKFDAAHKLPNYNGKCGNLHGHTWKVVVDIEGKKDGETGMVVDFGKIKEYIDVYDHRLINPLLTNPTAENLAEQMASDIKNLSSRINRVTLKVYESENSYAEVTI